MIVPARSRVVVFGALLFVVWFTWEVNHKSVSNQNGSNQYVDANIGDYVCRPDHKPWAAPDQNAVVLVSTASCSACELNKPFEEDVFEYCQAHNIPVFYVLETTSDNDARARELVMSGRTVVRHDLKSFGITRLPTALRVKGSGKVESMWTGTVSHARHDSVLASVVSGSSLQSYRRIELSEINSYSNRGLQLLALSAISGQVTFNGVKKIIPVGELSVRAPYELNPRIGTVVDCGSTLVPMQCQSALITLAKLQYTELIAAALPSRRENCGF